MLLNGNIAMDIETDLILQRYQHLQFHPKSDTMLCFPSSPAPGVSGAKRKVSLHVFSLTPHS